ncbi:MAG: OST-HTH/LOTUS domain-containing protein [Candidatus Thiodiazotropha sp. (ex Lucinoma borealis)]|nr:OST-HTH/LOTUS domain-containing protein [Candidatus Thiodiazotropha sp. (ex Lucinoma borealis)]
MRDLEKPIRKRKSSSNKSVKKKASKQPVSEEEKRKQAALNLVVATVEDLIQERGEMEKVWGSMVKQTLKRRKPGFSERYHGFSTFSKLLEEAQARKLLILEADEKSGGYMIRSVVTEEV